MAQNIRLAIVDDESLFRELLATGLARQASISVVGCFGSAAEAVAGIPPLNADVVIIDSELRGMVSGIDVGLALRREVPDLAVVLLSGQRKVGLLDAVPRDDLANWSCVLKSALQNISALGDMVDKAHRGISFRDPVLASRGHRTRHEVMSLTGRQGDVLALIAAGHSNAAIARALNLTEKSVQNNVTRLYQRLGIDARNPDEHPRVLALRHYLGQDRVLAAMTNAS